MNTMFATPRLIGAWVLAGALVAAGPAMGANPSTTMLALLLCVTPAIVTTLRTQSAESPSLTQHPRAGLIRPTLASRRGITA